MYWCKKCKHQHKEGSKIGQRHKTHKFVEATYYCSKCNHNHRISSNIGKNHFEYFKEEEEEKTEESQQPSLLRFEEEEKERGELVSEIPPFEGQKGKIEERYQAIPHLSSTIFSERDGGELIVNNEKVSRVERVHIEELPPAIVIQGKNLLQKAKAIHKPIFINKIIAAEEKTYFELELPTFDLVLYKES